MQPRAKVHRRIKYDRLVEIHVLCSGVSCGDGTLYREKAMEQKIRWKRSKSPHKPYSGQGNTQAI